MVTNATKAQRILKNVIYSTVATTDADGLPWAAPQFTLYDEASKTLYWCAVRSSQHGQNILHNHKAYIVVYDSMAAPGEGEGVYIQADASEVVDTTERARVHSQLTQKHQGAPYWTLADIQAANAAVVLFKARVIKAWINVGSEEAGQFVLRRKQVEL